MVHPVGKSGVSASREAGALPDVSLLSNGRYSVLLTEAGSGYGSWRGLDITRWREDGTRDCWGQFCYIRDLESNEVWTIGRQPIHHPAAAYQHSFHVDRAEYHCHYGDIDIRWEVCVAPDCDAEVRVLFLHNTGSKTKRIELTSYSEICLNSRRADSAHPAFAKLFIETRFDAETGALFARRRPRSAAEKPIWAVHVSASSDETHHSVEHDTDRHRFLGRHRTPTDPRALGPGRSLSGTTGPVLDPIFSLRRVVVLGPAETQQVAFATGAAEDEETAATIAKRFADVRSARRALSDATASCADGGLPSPEEATLFNRLAGTLLFSRPGLHGTAAQEHPGDSGFQSAGISGHLPIVLLRVDKQGEAPLIDTAIDAHAFITGRGFPFDLAILDETEAITRLPLSTKASVHMEATLGKAGGIHVVSTENVGDAIAAKARAVLCCGRGSLAEQLAPAPAIALPIWKPTKAPLAGVGAKRRAGRDGLHFWNGRGGFSKDGREYVIATEGDRATPMPWCNVIANPVFGCMTSDSCLGYTWAGNSQLNRLTPWSNDPVSDQPGEIVYLRDESTATLWTPTTLPLGQASATTVRHGQGYTRYESDLGLLHHELTVHVPVAATVKIVRLSLRNDGRYARNLTATYFVEWVLGILREDGHALIECEFDIESSAIVAARRGTGEFSGDLAFVASSAPVRSFTCDRLGFLGREGSISQPAGLVGLELDGRLGSPLDPCAALMVDVSISPASTVELVFVLGQAKDHEEIRRLVREHAEPGSAKRSLAEASRQWDQLLNSVTVRTPDKAFDLMMNRWLLYQVLSCRIWARTGFYQSGGAYGFRDQLQDVAALVHSAPEETRAHILRAAARQFTEGDVQHWWHPPSGAGVRTRMTDDLYFLPYVVHRYVTISGDYKLLNELVPFIVSPTLNNQEEERFEVPGVSQERGTVYDHCCRALDQGLRLGRHGLPLMGTGDWNDGMNRVGAEGKGESVWNGWFFLTVLGSFAAIAKVMGDKDRVAWCTGAAEALRVSLERHAWDGSWYRRAYFDDGTPLGSSLNDECQIDAIPQAWAVISGAADTERASMAMRAVWQRLVRTESKLIQLFDPPFDKGALQPGYIKGYVPGIRENGGQYTHAATWVALATALLGDGDRAFQLWSMLNPINHSLSPEDAERYMVEPYVVSADVYGAPPHTGRGGWTWYTGSAAWMYRVGLEAILGIRRQGNRLFVKPCIPTEWSTYEVDFRHGRSIYRIKVRNDAKSGEGSYALTLDGKSVGDLSVPLVDDGRDHNIHLVVG
ncbi:Cellobiose phosphorylase [Ensifer adhaerens]|uniref:GH36-type glycosyl hydrolase domain-containing protein n=1 Tax=Ensifer adhaerens TaxID=106592 RepID=UPI001569EAB5|nr:glycosyl transferase [Ensifer adhaerens]NRP21296.1 Cellobiose phosphorylase [Ensifer adhaerens]